MSWNTLSIRDKSAFMNVALRHGVTDLAAIKRAYDSLGGDNVMADGGPAKTKEPPFSLAQRAAENRLRRANLFDDGGQEDVIDWGNVDLKAMRDAYQQSQEDNVRTYTAVPASRMSYNEDNGLWWDSGTGTWHSQDNMVFPSNKEYPVTVVHDRNTNRDFTVPSDEYVRPLNTQDYFDHTGSNALEFANLMTSPTNLFMPSHVAGAIWDTYDKLSGKNPDVNLWDSWLHENQGIGRTGNPYLNAGLNFAGDIAGFSSKNALKRAALNAERFAGSRLFSLSDALVDVNKASDKAAGQLVLSRSLPKYYYSPIGKALARGAYNGLKLASSASDAARNATLKSGLYLMSKYNEARDPVARRALEEIFTQKQDNLSQLARSYGLDYTPGTSPYIMARDLPIDYSGKYFIRGPRGYDTSTYASYRNAADAPGGRFIAINPTMSRVPDHEFAGLLKHEGTHAFDHSPSTRSFMYNVAKHEHPKFHVFPSRGVYRNDDMLTLDGLDKPFWTPIDNMHRATHRIRDLYYPEEFSKKARSVMPVARGVRPRRTQSHSDIERNADLTEIRARFARKLGLDPMSPGFNEAFANEVQALPDKRFLILNPGSKPRFSVFDDVVDSYTRDWTDGLMQQYGNLSGDASAQQEFARDFIDTMKDLLINYRAHGGRLNKFDGVNNLDRPNQMETAFDDLVAARDRYAQTGDINTSWEPVDLNDVSITDNGFVTREGRVGDSFVLPEATIIGQRPVVNEAIPEEEPDDNSFLGRLRAARNRVKYGHSKLTEEDKAMTRYANKLAAVGSGAIAAGVAAPYFAPYLASNVGTVLNAMQPSTYLDAIASGLGAQVGNYGLGASTMAGALGNAAMASGLTAEGLDYLYNTYLAGNNQRSFGDDLNASLALAPFLAAPAAGAKKLIDLSRNSDRLMTRLEHANRLTRYLSAPRRARRYVDNYTKSIEELRNKEKADYEELTRRFLVQRKFDKTYGKEDNFVIKRAPQIDVSKASKEDILKYLRKHDLPEDMFMFNEKGEPIIDASGNPIFNSGRIEVPVFGTNGVKTFDIAYVGRGKNLRTGAITEINDKQYDAKKLADYYKLTRDNIKYVEKATGGKAFGSSAMVGFEEVPHATHDYDVFVTEEMADKKMPGWRDNLSNGLTHYQLDEGKYGNVGNIDVNVIEQGPDGKATGTRAMELFRQFFPVAYNKEAEAAMLKGLNEKDMKITKTPQELLDAYDPVTKTVMDALEIDYKQPRKEKHATRILGYLAYSQNPKSVAKGIDNFAKMLVGKGYRPAPKLNFSDRETNIKFINTMFGDAAVPLRRIADSPERMQNLFDMFYLGETAYVREIDALQVPKTQRDMALNLWPNQGGTSNGKLVNTVKGGRSYMGSQVVVSQIPVELKEGMSISDAWKKISRVTGYRHYKFTAEDLAADSRLGEYLGIKEGDEAFRVLGKISNMSSEPITEADNVLRDPERFQDIRNNSFYFRDNASDKRTRIAGEILKDNGFLGLEGTHYLNGAYMTAVENLPYVSRQNLYWPSNNSFKGLRERAGDIRRSDTEPNVVMPMMADSHNGKLRFIEAGIRSMANKIIKEPVESPMSKTRKRLNDEIDALRAKKENTRKIRKLQERRLRSGTELLGGNSLGHMETEFKYNKRENTNNAIINGSLGLFGVGLAGSVPLMVKGYAENQGKYVSEAMRNLYGDDTLINVHDENQARRFYDEHKDEIDAEIKRIKAARDKQRRLHNKKR